LLAPREEIAVVGTGRTFYFDVSLDVCLAVFPQGRLLAPAVLPWDMVDKSITLCKDTSGWFFRPEAVRKDHLNLE
jgi:hypothetical protein